jgi:phospholipid-binding lipoprotein MlaA
MGDKGICFLLLSSNPPGKQDQTERKYGRAQDTKPAPAPDRAAKLNATSRPHGFFQFFPRIRAIPLGFYMKASCFPPRPLFFWSILLFSASLLPAFADVPFPGRLEAERLAEEEAAAENTTKAQSPEGKAPSSAHATQHPPSLPLAEQDLDEDDEEETEGDEGLEDPFEGWNRAVFTFNEGFDTLFFNPIAQTYRIMLPPVIQNGVTSVLQNAGSPLIFMNYLFQGKATKAARCLIRFVVNTTLGIGGLFDVAAELDLGPEPTDFGKTLESWGGEPGPYLVYPFLGPSTPRDSLGLLMDFFLDPFRLYMYHRRWNKWNDLYSTVSLFDSKKNYMETLREIQKTSVDAYSAVRSIYRQKRLSQNLQNIEE